MYTQSIHLLDLSACLCVGYKLHETPLLWAFYICVCVYMYIFTHI